MKDDLSTPEELGEKLKRGEITKEEAIEVMSERARREAFAGLYTPLPPGGAATAPATAPRQAWRAVAGFALILIGVLVLLWALLSWLD
jgi:hypothetical protein